MKNSKITSILLILLLALAFFLIFNNLSNVYLWQDEAESASLARNIIKFGYPAAFDGINIINPTIYTGFGQDYLWKFHPWLHFYVTALSFAAFGQNTFAARLPFAIFGFLSIILVFSLAKRFFKKDGIALLSVLFAITSVPLLLHIRQCRYYGLLMFLVLAIVWTYLKIAEKKEKYLWQLGALLLALCYTNHGTFIPVFSAIIVHFFFIAKDTISKKKFALMCAAVIGLALPWFIYSYSHKYVAALNPVALRKNFEFQIRILNKYIFPLSFFTALYLINCFKNKTWRLKIDESDKKGIVLILLLIAVNLCFYTFVEQRTIRYYIHLFPFLYILEAYLLLRFLSKHKILLAILIGLIIFTDILHSSLPYMIKAGLAFKKPEKRTALLKKVDFYFPMYLYEITHDYDGPVEGTVKFLKEHAKPGDAVKVAYDDSSLIFYLPYLKIENRHFFDDKNFPKWIVWRDYWINEYKNYYEDYKFQGYKLYDEKYVQEIKTRYIAHEIPYPDIIWENRPDDMEYHKFKTSDEPRKVIIYERKAL